MAYLLLSISVACYSEPQQPSVVLSPREWTDASGAYTVDAVLTGFDEPIVKLKRMENAEIIPVPLERLSEADQQYVRDVVARIRAATPVVQPDTVIDVGEKFPELPAELTPVQLNPFQESKFPQKWEPGRWYLIVLTGSWCPPCMEVMPHVQRVHEAFGDNLTVIAASYESAEATQRSVQAGHWGKVGYDVAAIPDRARTLGSYSRVETEGQFRGKRSIPYAFLIDGNGRLQWSGSIPADTIHKAEDFAFFPLLGKLAK